MASMDWTVLLISLSALLLIYKLGIGSRIRGMLTKRRVAGVGGFSLGMFAGPMVWGFLGGMFGSLFGISTTNIAGLSNISLETMLIVAVVIGGVLLFVRMGDD